MMFGHDKVITEPCIMEVGGIQVFVLPYCAQQTRLVYTRSDGFRLKVQDSISERCARLFLESELPWMRQQLHITQVEEEVSKMQFDGYPIRVKLQNRKSMKVQFVDNKYVQLTVPANYTADNVAQLLSENKEKVRAVIRRVQEKTQRAIAEAPQFVDGEKVNLMSQDWTLHFHVDPARANYRIQIDRSDWHFFSPIEMDLVQRRYVCKKLAERLFERYARERYDYWVTQMDLKYKPELYFSDMNSRWGVCYPSRRRIGLSRQLLYQSMGAIDTTIVHELCHLTVSNHSSEFYALMAKYKPDYDDYRKELKRPITWRF